MKRLFLFLILALVPVPVAAATLYNFSISGDFTSAPGKISNAGLTRELNAAVSQMPTSVTVNGDTVIITYSPSLPGGQEAAQTTAVNNHTGIYSKKEQKNCVVLVQGTAAMAAGATYVTIGSIWVGSPERFVNSVANSTVELEGFLSATGTGAGCRLVEADEDGASAVVLKTGTVPDTSGADKFFSIEAGSAVRAGRWQYGIQCRLNGASAGNLKNVSACLVETKQLR